MQKSPLQILVVFAVAVLSCDFVPFCVGLVQVNPAEKPATDGVPSTVIMAYSGGSSSDPASISPSAAALVLNATSRGFYAGEAFGISTVLRFHCLLLEVPLPFHSTSDRYLSANRRGTSLSGHWGRLTAGLRGKVVVRHLGWVAQDGSAAPTLPRRRCLLVERFILLARSRVWWL